MEEVPENGKESSRSAHANGMKSFLSHLHKIKLVFGGGGRRKQKENKKKKLISTFIVLLQETKNKTYTETVFFTTPVPL
jgi:uncharacterized protein Veg